MKRAVSISIGSSKRNKAVETTLLGEKVSIERIGTDGDMEAAALKYKELDGKVDAFGVRWRGPGRTGGWKMVPVLFRQTHGAICRRRLLLLMAAGSKTHLKIKRLHSLIKRLVITSIHAGAKCSYRWRGSLGPLEVIC